MKAETVRVMSANFKGQKLSASFGTVEFDAQGIGHIPVAFAEVFSKMRGFSVMDAVPKDEDVEEVDEEITSPSDIPEELAAEEREYATTRMRDHEDVSKKSFKARPKNKK